MPEIRFVPSGKRVTVAAGTLLADACRAAGFSVAAPCGGKGICGKCRVRVLRGAGAEGRDFEWRVACVTPVASDLVVADPAADAGVVAMTSFLGGADGARAFSGQISSGQVGIGAAVDLGTTTLAVARCDLETGAILSVAGAENPQSAFGADVVSRVEYALRGTAEREELRACVVAKIAELAGDGVSLVAVAGNTVMSHLLLGEDVSSLAVVPFAPAFRGAARVCGGEIGWPGAEGDPEILVLPNIGAYVGGDVVAGLLAHGVLESAVPTLFLDVGTNGEMVLATGGRAFACAVAAGPAFEGARISAGMRAAAGAISRVDRVGGEFVCEVIGGGAVVGICGTGLLDAVAAFLDAGVVDSSGWMEGEADAVSLCGVSVTQRDVREFQLAKGAVGAGVRVLLARAGVDASALGRVVLAGGFGNFLRASSALRVGLLPGGVSGVAFEKIVSVGNAALAGAWEYLCDVGSRGRALEICERVEYVELSGEEEFAGAFVEEMAFP